MVLVVGIDYPVSVCVAVPSSGDYARMLLLHCATNEGFAFGCFGAFTVVDDGFHVPANAELHNVTFIVARKGNVSDGGEGSLVFDHGAKAGHNWGEHGSEFKASGDHGLVGWVFGLDGVGNFDSFSDQSLRLVVGEVQRITDGVSNVVDGCAGGVAGVGAVLAFKEGGGFNFNVNGFVFEENPRLEGKCHGSDLSKGQSALRVEVPMSRTKRVFRG